MFRVLFLIFNNRKADGVSNSAASCTLSVFSKCYGHSRYCTISQPGEGEYHGSWAGIFVSVVAICACTETGRGGLIHVWRLQEIPEGSKQDLLKLFDRGHKQPSPELLQGWRSHRLHHSPSVLGHPHTENISWWPMGISPNTGPTSPSQYWLSQIFWATFQEPLTPRDLILHLVQKENVSGIAQLGKNLLDSSLFSCLGTAEPVFCNSSLLVSVFLCFVVEVFVCFF